MKSATNGDVEGNPTKVVNDIPVVEVNNKRGIFARRAMVDQAREGLRYQRET